MQTRVPVWGNKASKPLIEKTCGDCSGGRNSQPHRRVRWKAHRVLECTQNHPPGELAPEGPNLLVSIGKWLNVTESWANSIVPSLTPPPSHTAPQRSRGLPHPVQYLRLCPLQCNRCAETKKYDPNERTDQSSKNRTKWWRDRQPFRCTVQNTG